MKKFLVITFSIILALVAICISLSIDILASWGICLAIHYFIPTFIVTKAKVIITTLIVIVVTRMFK